MWHLFFHRLTVRYRHCRLWYVFFQTATIEIYELYKVRTLYMKDNAIYGEVSAKSRCGPDSFIVDCPEGGEKATRDLFFEVKEAWNISRQTALQDEDQGDWQSDKGAAPTASLTSALSDYEATSA